MRKTECLAMILAGGQGSRLGALTKRVAKPAVPFGGKYRIIDFPLSNCVNSGIEKVGVLTQYRPLELNQYLGSGSAWDLDKRDGGLFVLPPYAREKGAEWYRGTADAIYQNLNFIDMADPDYVLILSGDHIYTMDYAWMLEHHKKCKAQATIGVFEVPWDEAPRFGIMNTDESGRIVAFEEKPAKPKSNLASMGIYIFNRDYLAEYLTADARSETSSHDFGKDIIPKAVGEGQVVAHFFQDSCVYNSEKAPAYWRDVGTIDAYWEANIDLTATVPELNLYDRSWPIWTYQEQLPPAKFVHNEANRRGEAIESSVSAGCILSGSVHNSLLFSNCRVHSYTQIHGAVLLPEVQVGRNVRLTKVVVDRGCRIPDGLVVGEDPDDDARRFYRSEGGVTLITPRMLEKLQG